MTLKQFRSFDLAQRENGDSLEIERTDRRVVCLTFDTRRLCFAELCALLGENGLDDEGVREFTERAQIAASIVHKRWAGLFDSGIDDGVYYYAREFVDGERLGDYLRRMGTVSNRVALDVVLQLAEAIEGLGEHTYLIEEVDLNDARVFCDRAGVLELKMAGFPLEPAPLSTGLLGNTAEDRLRKMFRQMRPPAMQSLLGEMDDVDDLEGFLRRVRGIRARYPETRLEGEEQPRRVIEKEIYQRWRPREFLSQEFKVISDLENLYSPYSEALEGPNRRLLRLQVLPPVRMLRDEFLTFYKSGVHPAAIAVHAEWKNEDFRLIAEEKLTGASLATIFRADESVNPVEANLLLERIDQAIVDLEGANVLVPDFQPENVFLCPARDSKETIEELIGRRPLTDWPEFRVRIRTHLTMSGLVHPPDAAVAQQSSNDVMAYLALKGQGFHEKARLLLGKVKKAAEEYIDNENAISVFRIPPEERNEVLPSPLFGDLEKEELDEPVVDDASVVDEEIEELWEEQNEENDEDEDAWEDNEEPEHQGLGYEAYVDSGDWEEEEDEELNQPVLSPIAAAMGIQEEDAYYHAGETAVVDYPAAEWQRRGHGLLFWLTVLVLAGGLGAMAVMYIRG